VLNSSGHTSSNADSAGVGGAVESFLSQDIIKINRKKVTEFFVATIVFFKFLMLCLFHPYNVALQQSVKIFTLQT
jgi:hypothetical protein